VFPVRWPGWAGGAFAPALIFLLHFLQQGKKWNKKATREKETRL